MLEELPVDEDTLTKVISAIGSPAPTELLLIAQLHDIEKACIDLVINTSNFLKNHKDKLDEWTIQLLENPNLEKYILLH